MHLCDLMLHPVALLVALHSELLDLLYTQTMQTALNHSGFT